MQQTPEPIFPGKTLLLMGAGVESIPVYQQARAMQLTIIGVDKNPDAPARSLSDQFVTQSVFDPQAILAELSNRQLTINGVVAACTDTPLTVARIGAALGLATLSLPAAENVADKYLMKRTLLQASIPTASGVLLHNMADLQNNSQSLAFPVILKPVDNRGARGVFFCENAEQLSAYFPRSLAESKSARVLLEEFLDGPQVSTEGIMLNGKLNNLGFSDRNYEWLARTKPYMIENGGEYPSHLDSTTQADVLATFEAAANALGIANGIVKGDMVVHQGKAKIIELAGRLSGGYFSTLQIPHATGVNLVAAVIQQALGETVSAQQLTPRHAQPVAIRYKKCEPGRVVAIDDSEAFYQSEQLIHAGIFCQPGDHYKNVTNHTDRAAFAIAGGTSASAAITAANSALDHLHITMAEV